MRENKENGNLLVPFGFEKLSREGTEMAQDMTRTSDLSSFLDQEKVDHT